AATKSKSLFGLSMNFGQQFSKIELLALPEERQFREKQHAFSIFYGVGTTLILLGLVCFGVLFFNLRELAGVCVGVLVGGAAGAAAGYDWEQEAIMPSEFLVSLPQ